MCFCGQFAQIGLAKIADGKESGVTTFAFASLNDIHIGSLDSASALKTISPVSVPAKEGIF